MSSTRLLRTGGATAGSVTTRMQQLRHRTTEAHARIERALPSFEASLTPVLYMRVLVAFYGFYAPLEPLCQRAVGQATAGLDLAGRAKTPSLAADLVALGHTPSSVLALPRCTALPSVTSMSEALGALYVMEGATLGGQIISRHLDRSLQLHGHDGAAFFSGYGNQTREMWRRFNLHVESADELDMRQAVSAAVETFATLEVWLVATLAPS